ncbi:MAG: Alpha-2-macroglobulin domain protein [Candidatus Woesebacteria bacterium GW2011_GWF2_46_8]|uniref:Alpha-2-macroglobulin domain protein n=1 Tax=Candidatus Woesebacteria bacterium GW2011_GWF2_46_8 TaxID=1618604 RepID=A0A0G1TRZ1_9BACT|nr:MAG: Alpha-2-macroglobulin domain protein [Candidatus Woesebacteria bacterium GW2011_GWF2_46_8]
MKKTLFFPVLLLATILLSLLNIKLSQNLSTAQGTLPTKQNSETKEVLGLESPEIFISKTDGGYGKGAVVSLSSTADPALILNTYNISGLAQFSLYKASEEVLISYLLHDKDGNTLQKSVDISSLELVSKFEQAITSGTGGTKVSLPIKDALGIWFLQIKIDNFTENVFVIRSNLGTLVKEGDNQFVFWVQDFKTKRSVASANIRLFSLFNEKKEVGNATTDTSGITKASLVPETDIAIVSLGDDKTLVPINLRYMNLNYFYARFQPKSRQTPYFVFSDRPVYKPGDTIYFKAILRDDDDARYSIPKGVFSVKIYGESEQENPVFEKKLQISSDGTIFGEFKTPENIRTGFYTLQVNSSESSDPYFSTGYIYFNIEHFRKPEYSIEVNSDSNEYIAGNKAKITISGNYFFGQPLSNQKIKYRVYSADFFEYEVLTERAFNLGDKYRYGGWYGDKISESSLTLDKEGKGVINLDTALPQEKTKSQVFSIEAELDDGSGNPSFARKNILVYSGEFGIYKTNFSRAGAINNPLNLEFVLSPYKETNVSSVKLTAKPRVTIWTPYQDPNEKYLKYNKEEKDLPAITAITDSNGKATMSFTPTIAGSYTITVLAQDKKGNNISKEFWYWVSKEGEFFSFEGEEDGISVQTDKNKYSPDEVATITITSNTPDRDVFLSFDRGRVNRYQIVSLNGKTKTIKEKILNTDMPNIFAVASSFSNKSLESNSKNIIVSAESQRLETTLKTDKDTYGPGETVTLDVETKTSKGSPISANTAVWAVDKAIFELSDSNLGDVFETFWAERYNTTSVANSLEGINTNPAEGGGGCFGEGTKVLMANGKTKNIEDIKTGDFVLTRSGEKETKLIKAKVKNVHSTEVAGYLIINGKLKVTPNHILWANGGWKNAGSLQSGDILTDSDGKSEKVFAIEWQNGTFKVYNLEVDKYNTYFAEGVWVHNQKGAVREIFKDTAYWNPNIRTDSSGKAQVRFQLPDNLTTWVLALVASTTDTVVGQTLKEIVVTKDVVLRPILPNILREGDEIVLSAIVQNFTDKKHPFEIELKFDSGEVESPTKISAEIEPKKLSQVYWKVKPNKENSAAKLTFSASSTTNKEVSDIIIQEIPVWKFGFFETKGQAGYGPTSFDINLPEKIDPGKSQITLSLSPTIIGSLPSAMKYLIEYPWGCVEQITSRFVPAVVAKNNPGLFSSFLEDKKIDETIRGGITKLYNLQKNEGGWSWWQHGQATPFITSYVVEYLLKAREVGFSIDNQVLERAKNYLENQATKNSKEQEVAIIYGLSLLGSDKGKTVITDFDGLTPDILSLAVMANARNNVTDPSQNCLSKLLSSAKSQGDAIFWEGGGQENFGSIDASTAFAIRAIILANGDRETAAKAAQYLLRNRKSDYWSNTFATAQVIEAITSFVKTGEELAPNYSYKVMLDGEVLRSGSVNSVNKKIEDINIDPQKVKKGDSKLEITLVGEGQIYSTLVSKIFVTDTTAGPENNGLEVKREYVNDRGKGIPLAVGDTVTVNITLSGLSSEEKYGVIEDELPSGMIPINPVFINEQYATEEQKKYYVDPFTDREVTKNGMVLSTFRITPGSQTFSYKARVVSRGVFLAPPAKASLMYAPEINGRTSVHRIELYKEAKISPLRLLTIILSVVAGILVVASIIALIIFIKKRKNKIPPTTPPQQTNAALPTQNPAP